MSGRRTLREAVPDTAVQPALRTLAYGSARELAEAVLDVVIRGRTIREVARETDIPRSTLQRHCSRFEATLRQAIASRYIPLRELVGHDQQPPSPRAGRGRHA